MDVCEIYRRAGAGFSSCAQSVGGRWDAPTPLPGWNVRELVHHLVHEERWTPPLLAGETIEQVGSRFDGDLLGDDPLVALDAAAAQALAAVEEDGALERTVHLSFGDHPGHEYVMQLAADHLVHTADLARALDVDDTLDPEVVDAVLRWFGPTEAIYHEIGVIGPRIDVPPDAGPRAELLGRFGRSPS